MIDNLIYDKHDKCESYFDFLNCLLKVDINNYHKDKVDMLF